jgi:hypothetical protein
VLDEGRYARIVEELRARKEAAGAGASSTGATTASEPTAGAEEEHAGA